MGKEGLLSEAGPGKSGRLYLENELKPKKDQRHGLNGRTLASTMACVQTPVLPSKQIKNSVKH
jgi:hypothetical protein